MLEHSLREALSLGHDYIGTEHVLLGLIRESEGVASRVLLDLGSDTETVRNETIRMMSARSGAASAPAARPVQPPGSPWDAPPEGLSARRTSSFAVAAASWALMAAGAVIFAGGLVAGWLIWG